MGDLFLACTPKGRGMGGWMDCSYVRNDAGEGERTRQVLLIAKLGLNEGSL